MLLKYRDYFFRLSPEITAALGSLHRYSYLNKGNVIPLKTKMNDTKSFPIEVNNNCIQVKANEIAIPIRENNVEVMARTLEIAMFLFVQKQNVSRNIISLHASAVAYKNQLNVFLGPKQSGKSTMMYLLSKKKGFVVLANDYVELQIEKANIKLHFSDNNEKISFRKESLYKIGEMTTKKEAVLQKEMIVMQNQQITFDNKVFSKIFFIFPNLGKSNTFEWTRIQDIHEKLYREFIYYLKNVDVLCIDHNDLLPIYIDDNQLFDAKAHQHVIEVLKLLDKNAICEVYDLYGESAEFVSFIVHSVKS